MSNRATDTTAQEVVERYLRERGIVPVTDPDVLLAVATMLRA